MKHLLLLRHAKSSWSNPGMSDFERPLNERGRKSAQVMASHLASSLPLPDRIYCSTAQRTRETLSSLLKVYAHPCAIDLRRDFYLASPSVMLQAIRSSDPVIETVMMIAHNPGTEELALSLSQNQGDDVFTSIIGKYPTAACAHISFDVESWEQVMEKSGTLKAFVRPRDLMGD